MSAFYLTFLAVLLATLGARDQVTVAALALRQGSRPSALLVGVAVSLVSAAFAAWAASVVAPLFPPKARLVTAALALAVAGAESLWPFTARKPQEPTASLGALAMVLLAHQVTDAARFLIFAIAVAMAAPLAAGSGGAAAGAAAIAVGWMLPEVFTASRLRAVRWGVGVLLLIVALVVGFRALAA
jgi:hypothetical protein